MSTAWTRWKGYAPIKEGRKYISWLIDQFNKMLSSLDSVNAKFHYINLRTLLPEDSDEKQWRDEIHPRKPIFELISKEFDQEIKQFI